MGKHLQQVQSMVEIILIEMVGRREVCKKEGLLVGEEEKEG